MKTILLKQHSDNKTYIFNGENQDNDFFKVTTNQQNLFNNYTNFIFSKNYFLQWRMPLRRVVAKVM